MPWPSTDDVYMPKLDSNDQYLETAQKYCTRIAKVLPNFPCQVLQQWFYEHWNDIDGFAWLGFPSLLFTCETWITNRLLQCGAEKDEIVRQYTNDFESERPSPRSVRIAEFMAANGTLAVPPLLIENSDNNLVYPNGLRCLAPFHPIEGHHRFAVFFSYERNKRLKPDH